MDCGGRGKFWSEKRGDGEKGTWLKHKEGNLVSVTTKRRVQPHYPHNLEYYLSYLPYHKRSAQVHLLGTSPTNYSSSASTHVGRGLTWPAESSAPVRTSTSTSIPLENARTYLPPVFGLAPTPADFFIFFNAASIPFTALSISGFSRKAS